jgi:2-methylcitrate dehydratase PrpD
LSAAKEVVATKETITAKMSRWAASLDYKQLSQDAVYQAKRFLLDSVGWTKSRAKDLQR